MADVLDIHEGDDEFQVDEEGDSEYKMMISYITAIHSLLLIDWIINNKEGGWIACFAFAVMMMAW